MAKVLYDKYKRNSDNKVFFLYKKENYNIDINVKTQQSECINKKLVEKGKLFALVDAENIGNVKIETEENLINNYTKMEGKYELQM